MKIKNFFFASLAAAMFASCAENLGDGQDQSSIFDARGNAYAKVAINLPSASASTPLRAVGDPGSGYGEFDDGIKNEYTVENVTLCIFSDVDATNKDDEMQYKLIAAYSLSDAEWNKDTETQVTTNRTFVQQINAGDAVNSKLYAYVIVNKHEFFVLDGNKLTFKSQKAGDANVDLNGKTLKEFIALDLSEKGRRYDVNSFLMTNMPFATKPGGSKNPGGLEIHNLYPLTGAIYSTREEAEKPGATAAEINVERVLAKVETTLQSGIKTTANHGYKFQFLGWFIDNTNPCAYVGRHSLDPNTDPKNYNYLALANKPSAEISADNTYRFVSEFPVSAKQANRFRTFFAIDANYNVNAFKNVDANYNLINRAGEVVNTEIMKWENGENVGGDLRASGSFYYCTENTFDVKHQSESNTTRIVVVAQFVDESNQPKSFYTISNEADKMFTEAEAINYAKKRLTDRIKLQQWAAEYLKAEADAMKYVDVEITGNTKSGRCGMTVSEIVATDLADDDMQDASKKAAAALAFNNLVADCNTWLAGNIVIDFYQAGVAYYQALIKHFGDYETPWSAAAHAGVANSVTTIYDNNNEAKYLGRYGVVRNNWYKIDVTGVRQIGSAVVPPVPGKDPLDPDDPDTPDDQVENYLNVKINIMPWVIRKQSVVL